MGKYAKYFKGNEILPIPEIVRKVEPRVVSLVVTDLKRRRLVGLKKESFEELIRTASVPFRYFCRRSFAAWDDLLQTKEMAAKATACNIATKFFRLQPEYMGTRRIRVTVCNAPTFVIGEVLVSFLSAYGRVEEVTLLRSTTGTPYGDYVFRLCLTREGFQAIPETIFSRGTQMMVVVEGRRPRCWGCKQLGLIATFCPHKDQPATTTATTAATTEWAGTIKEVQEMNPGPDQPKTNEGWIEVTRKKGKKRDSTKTVGSTPPVKEKSPVKEKNADPA